MKFIFSSFILIFAFLLCSGVAKAQMPQPVPDPDATAIVYFYSLATTVTLGQVKKPVFLDDKEIAFIRPERYFIVVLDAGKHNFRLKNKKFGGIEMNFEAGKTYYIRINWESEGTLRPSGISKIAEESGAFDIKQLRPVDEGNIKDKTQVFTKLP